MTQPTSTASAEVAPCTCTRVPDVRILRRVHTRKTFPLEPAPVGAIRRIAIVDTETTGTDPLTDEIIDVAVVVIEVDSAGRIVGIPSAGEALRDPGRPIPPAITKLTGLTDEDVRGKCIDTMRLERVLGDADVRIAHNATFDIAFLERLMPGLAGAAWACSARDISWLDHGFDGAKLGHLLMQIGRYNTGHRAMVDVLSLVHLLAYRLGDGSTVIGTILGNAERSSVRIEATRAAFEKRSLLKARGYRWDADGKVWWTEVAEESRGDEVDWISREVTPWGPPPQTRLITWHQRHR